MSVDRAIATGAGKAAAIYHEARPPYPDALFDAIVRRTAIPPAGRILEIGCGTGRATLALAERGFRIHCLEPSPSLAVETRRNVERFTSVEVEDAYFEDWSAAGRDFDVVLSAQAFHWVDPSVRVPKAAEALKPGGAIAVFWRLLVHPQPALGAAFHRALRACKAEVPSLVSLLDELDPIKREIERSPSFDGLDVSRSQMSWTYDAAGYLRLLRTHPGFIAVSESTRDRLFAEIAAVVAEIGGTVDLGFDTILYVARRKWLAPAWARRLPLPIRQFGNRILGR